MAQQLPDDPTTLIGGILGSIATVATAIAGAYAVVRRSRTETSKEAASVAQSTVQATLDAMKTVIDGLTRELTRRQHEVEEIRAEIEETRKELRIVEREKTALDLTVQRQAEQLANMRNQLAAQSRMISRLKMQMDASARSDAYTDSDIEVEEAHND